MKKNNWLHVEEYIYLKRNVNLMSDFTPQIKKKGTYLYNSTDKRVASKHGGINNHKMLKDYYRLTLTFPASLIASTSLCCKCKLWLRMCAPDMAETTTSACETAATSPAWSSSDV